MLLFHCTQGLTALLVFANNCYELDKSFGNGEHI